MWRKPCTYLAPTLALSPNRLNGHPGEPQQLGVLLGVSKTISDPTVRLAQTVLLSYTNSNTVSEQTDSRFHMTHIT
jgi:hypothetical protein